MGAADRGEYRQAAGLGCGNNPQLCAAHHIQRYRIGALDLFHVHNDLLTGENDERS
jgi:hypothetical protein